MSDSERARVTTYVDVAPGDAFEVFTQEIDLWWRRSPRFRGRTSSELRFERDGQGRRLVECFEDEVMTGYREHVTGARTPAPRP